MLDLDYFETQGKKLAHENFLFYVRSSHEENNKDLETYLVMTGFRPLAPPEGPLAGSVPLSHFLRSNQ